jgi:hypothetical protein
MTTFFARHPGEKKMNAMTHLEKYLVFLFAVVYAAENTLVSIHSHGVMLL